MNLVINKRCVVCGPLPHDEPEGFDLTVGLHNYGKGRDIRYVFWQEDLTDYPTEHLFLNLNVHGQASSRYHYALAQDWTTPYYFATGKAEDNGNRHTLAMVNNEPCIMFPYLPLTGVFAIYHLLHLGAAEVHTRGMDFYGGEVDWRQSHYIPPQIDALAELARSDKRFKPDDRLSKVLPL